MFDSGVGGLTVLRALWELLPGEPVHYLADRDGFPYGTKSPEEILERARLCAHHLKGKGIELLVIACHTASAYAQQALEAELDIPVIGMIHPCKAKTVLTTEATKRSGIYQQLIPGAEVIACPEFVRAAEGGNREIACTFPSPILLGCTHFPLLKIDGLDPAKAVASNIVRHLSAAPALP